VELEELVFDVKPWEYHGCTTVKDCLRDPTAVTIVIRGEGTLLRFRRRTSVKRQQLRSVCRQIEPPVRSTWAAFTRVAEQAPLFYILPLTLLLSNLAAVHPLRGAI
jgi:hypothetical protein